jgi:hypothetical protein
MDEFDALMVEFETTMTEFDATYAEYETAMADVREFLGESERHVDRTGESAPGTIRAADRPSTAAD